MKRLKKTFLLRTHNKCSYRHSLIDHEKVLFSESSVSQIYFKLASISKNLSLNVHGFTVVFISLQHNHILHMTTKIISCFDLCSF